MSLNLNSIPAITMLSVPLEVWGWYGDDAILKLLRMCCSRFKFERVDRWARFTSDSCYCAISGRYANIVGHDYCAFIDMMTSYKVYMIAAGASVTPVTGPPKCVVLHEKADLTTVWDCSAAELRHLFRAFSRRHELRACVRDLSPCARVLHKCNDDADDAAGAASTASTANTTHARISATIIDGKARICPTFSAGTAILTAGAAFEHKYIIYGRCYSSPSRVTGIVPDELYEVI